MKFRLKLKELKRNQRGFTLIEVILAIALLGIIAVAFLSAMGTGSLSLFIADERATAESLARSQLEYVKNQWYKDAPWNSTVNYNGYTVNVSADPLNTPDDGIQKITVVVSHSRPDKEVEVITLVGYKVDR